MIRYDLKTGNFQKVIPYDEEKAPSGRDFHSAVIDNNNVYIIGGSDSTGKLNEIYKFEIEEGIPRSTLNSDIVS